MSNPEDRKESGGFASEAYPRLEAAVSAMVDQISVLRRELASSKRSGADLEELLRKFTQGEEDPSRMVTRLQRLEEENKALLVRLQKGREGVDRLLARIRFLEEQG